MHKKINILKYILLTFIFVISIGWTSSVKAEDDYCAVRGKFALKDKTEWKFEEFEKFVNDAGSYIDNNFPTSPSMYNNYISKVNKYYNDTLDKGTEFLDLYSQEFLKIAKDSCPQWKDEYNNEISNYKNTIKNMAISLDTKAKNKILELRSERESAGDINTVNSINEIINAHSDNVNINNEDFDDAVDRITSSINADLGFGNDVEVTCEGILSDVMPLIKKVYGWIQILAPILLIVFGSLDYGKAIITNDNDALKKATSNFVKRAIATVAIFLLPIILNLIFSLIPPEANITITTCDTGMIIRGENYGM